MDLTFALELVFVLCAAVILYVYAGYPILIFVIGKLRSKAVLKGDHEPSVSFVITAFNEGRDIEKKLENTLAIDYPKEKLEIVVASDCSTDATDEIVRRFENRGVTLMRQQQRNGKTAAQNAAVELAGGEIIVFSDATSMYEATAVRRLVSNFADHSVGCVGGRLEYVDPSASDVGGGARSYWNYESILKKYESLACSLIGVSGCIYAVRRDNYVPMYPEACSDFLIATLIFEQGLRTVYEPSAVCAEETNNRTDKEMRMRVRVISQTFTDLWRNRAMMNPFRSGFYAVQLISHKVLRYGVPLFIVGAFAASLLLAGNSIFFTIISALGLLFLAFAAGAWLFERLGIATGPFAIPLYFVLTNVASVAGFFQFLRGERYATWEPIRDAS
jgi:cellulose synthase/poly-beta-1,6-N-acetylglucosamine synthase-like glycosyltransferase